MRIPVDDLRRALDRRTLRRADIDSARYVAPLGSTGIHTVEYPVGSGNVVKVGSSLQGQTFRPGTVVTLGSHIGDPRKGILGGPPAGRRGASLFPVSSSTPGSLASIGIVSADPVTVEAGAVAAVVSLTGYGFASSSEFEAVVMGMNGWAVDSLVTVSTTTVSDSESATLSITVSSSAPIGHLISFRVIGSPSSVGAELMRVVEGTALTCPSTITGKTYVGVHWFTGTLHAHLYNDNVYVSQIATLADPFAFGSDLYQIAKSGSTYYVVGLGDDNGSYHVFSWDLSTNTLHYDPVGIESGSLCGLGVDGSTIYFASQPSASDTVTLYSQSLGSSVVSVVGSLTDTNITWRSNPRTIAVMDGAVLIQGRDLTRAAGDQRVWSNIGAGVKVVASFDESEAWGFAYGGQKSGDVSVAMIQFGADRIEQVDSAGVRTVLAHGSPANGGPGWNLDVAEQEWALSLDGEEIVLYQSGLSLFRVKVLDWTSLSGCTVNGTDEVEVIPAISQQPTGMYPRD